MNPDYEAECHSVRVAVKGVAATVKSLSEGIKSVAPAALNPSADKGEMIANVMLAYRHLEDASMRLGKAIQAANGGTSVYDRSSTVGA